MPPCAKQAQVREIPDQPQRDDRPDAWQRGDLCLEMRQTIENLVRRRLVARRRAADRGRDERIRQHQSIVHGSRCGQVGEPRAVERRHEEIARPPSAVAGKHAPGPIGAVGGGRKPDDQEAGARVTEPGHWTRPVTLVAVRAPLLPTDLKAVVPQSRAPFAGDDGVACKSKRFDRVPAGPPLARTSALVRYSLDHRASHRPAAEGRSGSPKPFLGRRLANISLRRRRGYN